MVVLFELLSVVLITLSLLGVGRLLSKMMKVGDYPWVLDGLLGAGVYAFLVSIAGFYIALFEYSWIFFISGFVLFTYGLYKKWFNFTIHLPWQVSLYLLFALFIALYPSSYFDPLNYHLYGIVEWSKLDKLVHLESAPQLMHNSYADYLYFPLSFWWGQKSTQDLLSLQVTSQVFTVIFGIGFFSVLMFELIKDKIEKVWIPLLIIAALARASLQHKGFIAKIDWIALSWFIASVFVFLRSDKNKTSHVLLSAFFLALSVGSKFSYVVPAGFWLLSILILERRQKKKASFIAFGVFFFGLAPYLLRNYFWTDNPFFPMARNFFPSAYLGPSWMEGFGFYDVGINNLDFGFFAKKLLRFFTYEPIVYFSLLIPLFFSRTQQVVKILWVFIYAFLVVFIFFFGSASELRHFGPIALLINVLGVIGLILVTSKFPRLQGVKPFISNLFLIIIFFNILNLENQLNPIPSALRRGVWVPRYQSLIDEKRGLLTSDFLSKNLSELQRIALIDDTPPYYLSLFNVMRLWDDPTIDRKIKKCNNLGCLLEVFKEEKIDYLIESDFLFDPYYNVIALNLILAAITQYPEAIVQDQNGERLISVQILINALRAK